MNAADGIAEFLESRVAEHGASANTIEAYHRDLLSFLEFLDFANLNDTSRQDILDYLKALKDRDFADKTRARHLSAIKQYYRFAYEEGWREDNPALNIPAPRTAKTLPHTLSITETEALLEKARNHGRNDADRARNAALFELLYGTGLRVSELVSLPVAQISALPDTITVRGKGNKDRLVPISDDAKRAVAAWLPFRDAYLKRVKCTSPYLFPSSGKLGHFTRNAFLLLIKDVAIKAGLDPKHVSPHVLRHSFATHLLQGGADLRVIQALLGHADIATTEIYTHILDEELSALVFEHHPLADKKGDDT